MTEDQILAVKCGVLVKTTLVDFPGTVASTVFLRGCNLRCPYCYNTELVLGPAFSISKEAQTEFVSGVQVLEHLFKRKNVISGLVISGGEPLLNPVTPILIKKAKAIGFKIKLDTNGTLPHLLAPLMADETTRPDFVAMDFKTSPERYGKDIPLLGNNGKPVLQLLKETINLISAYKSEHYEIRTVLVPGLVTKNEIRSMAEIIPQDASWQFAQFRNENCIDKSYNEITPYTDSQLNELIACAKSFIPNSALR